MYMFKPTRYIKRLGSSVGRNCVNDFLGMCVVLQEYDDTNVEKCEIMTKNEIRKSFQVKLCKLKGRTHYIEHFSVMTRNYNLYIT